MNRLILYILSILIVSIGKAEELSIDLSASQFRLDENHVRWELYYSFPETAIKYIMGEKGYSAQLSFSIKFNSSIKTELSDEWEISHLLAEKPIKSDMVLYGLRPFKLQPGQYQVELMIADKNDEKNKKTVNFPIIVRKLMNDRLEMSDILLSNLIVGEQFAKEMANPLFWKNNLYVYPNPSAEIYGKSPSLKLYFEVYNAKTYAGNGIDLHYHIYDGAQREVYYFPKKLESSHDGIVEHIEIPLDALPTGVYNLVVAAKARGAIDSVSSSKKFYFINFDVPPSLSINFAENMSFEKSEFATLNESQINLEFRKVRMIASKEENQQFALLSDPKAKAKFLFVFWKKRHTDTTTIVNMELVEHRRRIEYANRFFSWGKSDNGWDTDRGHVLLKYGEPSKRDAINQNGNDRAYETWFYSEIEGGVYFYFVDVGGFGNYQQVHSTKSGEFYNENWYELYVPVTKENRDQYKLNEDDRRYR